MVKEYLDIIHENRQEILEFLIDAILGGATDKFKRLAEYLMKEGRISDLVFYHNFELF